MRFQHAAGISAVVLGATGMVALLTVPHVSSCGTERWAVKTLQDAPALPRPILATVAQLRAIEAPPHITSELPRQIAETVAYTMTVRLVGAKLEADSDIHLVISDGATRTMIAEFPDAVCIGPGALASARTAMASARAAFVGACGSPTAQLRRLWGVARIGGVAFFDDLHGQAGAAPNGIELHPVLSFAITGPCQMR